MLAIVGWNFPKWSNSNVLPSIPFSLLEALSCTCTIILLWCSWNTVSSLKNGHSSSYCLHRRLTFLSRQCLVFESGVKHFVVTMENAWRHWGQMHSLNCGPDQKCMSVHLYLYSWLFSAVYFSRLISLHTFIVSHMPGHIILFGKRDRATITANLCVLKSYPEGFVQNCPNSKYF